MDVLTVAVLAQLLHGLKRGHQRVLDAADLGGDGRDIHVLYFRLRRDFLRRAG